MLGLTIAILTATAFDCMGPTKLVALSPDGSAKVVLMPSGDISIFSSHEKKPSAKAQLPTGPHHLKIVLNKDASTLIFVDRYDGIHIFDRSGKKLVSKSPKDLLTKTELANTPNKWACHPEGTWIADPKFTFFPNHIVFKIYNGREIEIPIRSGKG